MNRCFRDVDPYAVLSVVLPLAVYLCTLAPSVTFFDSGEFMTAIHSLGAAHSPGYPLFITYAKPFGYLPLANVAFRINVATAVSAAAACYTVYLLVTRLAPREKDAALSAPVRAAALAAALTFAFSPRLWLQSNHDKPYPLVTFLAGIIFYLLLEWRDSFRSGEERIGLVYCGAFLTGLATGAHHLIVLMLPGYAWVILSTDRKAFRRVREILIAFGFSLLGFAVYLHMPIRAVRDPLLNWGDSKTLTQFLWNFLRKGYPMVHPERNLALLWDQVCAFNISLQFTVVGVLVAVAGIALSFRRLSTEIAFFAISVLTFLLYIVGYQNTPRETIFLTEEFFTPLYLFVAVFVGVGFCHLLRWGGGLHAAGVKGAAAATFLLPGLVFALNCRENNQRSNYMAFDYATNSLRSLPQGSVMFTWGDSGAFPLWYLQGVERMREDLDLLHVPHLVFEWYLNAFPKVFRGSTIWNVGQARPAEDLMVTAIVEQWPRRPVFIDFSTRYSVPFDQFVLQQRGLVYGVEPAGSRLRSPDPNIWSLYNERGLYGDSMAFRDLDTYKAMMIYANAHLEQGETFMMTGNFTQGIAEFRRAEAISPELHEQAARIASSFRVPY